MIIIFEGKKKKITFNGKAYELLKKLGINSQIVVIFRNGKIITEEDLLYNDDKVEIERVIFGG
jgi:sulfur carrier protein ThiS